MKTPVVVIHCSTHPNVALRCPACIGSKGGAVKSKAKTKAARRNGKLAKLAAAALLLLTASPALAQRPAGSYPTWDSSREACALVNEQTPGYLDTLEGNDIRRYAAALVTATNKPAVSPAVRSASIALGAAVLKNMPDGRDFDPYTHPQRYFGPLEDERTRIRAREPWAAMRAACNARQAPAAAPTQTEVDAQTRKAQRPGETCTTKLYGGQPVTICQEGK